MTFAKLLAAKEKRRLPNEMCCGRQPAIKRNAHLSWFLT